MKKVLSFLLSGISVFLMLVMVCLLIFQQIEISRINATLETMQAEYLLLAHEMDNDNTEKNPDSQAVGDVQNAGDIQSASNIQSASDTISTSDTIDEGKDDRTEREEILTPDSSGDGVGYHGFLHFDGTVLKDQYGNDVSLRGVSSHGLLWFPEYTNPDAIRTIKEHGANVFRIAMYANDANGGYSLDREKSMDLMTRAIDNAKSEDMYVIVDWHVLSEQDPNVDIGDALVFFDEISKKYGDDPAIIYEICNEPNGATTWDMIRNYGNQVIPCIRNNAPSSIIIVGTPQFSYRVNEVVGFGFGFENIAYSFHFYAGQHPEEYRQIVDECLANNVPVFISEWGINHDAGGDEAYESAKRFVYFINERGLPWCAWSLCNKDECFSILKNDCNKLSGWNESDLTEAGKIVFEGLSGNNK